MPQLISYGKEMLRVSPKGIEYSTNGGRSWMTRYSGSSCGTFIDLLPYGNELLAVTTKGIYYSTSEGRLWMSRYTGSSLASSAALQMVAANSLPQLARDCTTPLAPAAVG